MKFVREGRLPRDFPVEYKKGVVKFLNCKIDLSKKVFIPRIETEFWVKKAIKELPEAGPRAILDVFAGSGCIGIAILKNIKNSLVDFVDVDERAISQIKINLKLNEIPKERYKIYQSNLFEKLKNKRSKKIISSSSSFLLRKNSMYDFIFANPPYVAKERLGEVESAVLKYEPKRAFLAGKGGLFYIRGFLKKAKKFLKQNGVIYLEIDPFQKEEIRKILLSEGYKEFKLFKDQFKKYRFVKIKCF